MFRHGPGDVHWHHVPEQEVDLRQKIADETGTIMPGKRADIVVLAGDPFDLANLKGNIRAVYSAGAKVRSGGVDS